MPRFNAVGTFKPGEHGYPHYLPVTIIQPKPSDSTCTSAEACLQFSVMLDRYGYPFAGSRASRRMGRLKERLVAEGWAPLRVLLQLARSITRSHLWHTYASKPAA